MIWRKKKSYTECFDSKLTTDCKLGQHPQYWYFCLHSWQLQIPALLIKCFIKNNWHWCSSHVWWTVETYNVQCWQMYKSGFTYAWKALTNSFFNSRNVSLPYLNCFIYTYRQCTNTSRQLCFLLWSGPHCIREQHQVQSRDKSASQIKTVNGL